MIEKLIDHMHWANATVIAWLKDNPGAPGECPRLLSHVLNAEKIWAARARREDYERDVFKVHALEALPALNDANHAGFRGLLATDMRRIVDYSLLDGSPGRSSIEDMILHVFSHGFHHAGQMAALASRAGLKFPNVSYIGFTRSKPDPPISFHDGAAYERYMGAWSRLAGESFLDWLAPEPGLAWLDIGCGTGAFTEILAARCAPASLAGVDPSEEQLAFARQRPPLRGADFRKGDAAALPFAERSFDAAVMPLVLFFLPDPARGVAEMARVVRPGGRVTAYSWDMPGGGFPYAVLQEEMRALGVAPLVPPSPEASRLDVLRTLWQGAGLVDVETREIAAQRTYAGFEAYWEAVLGGPSVGGRIRAMSPDQTLRLQAALRERLPQDPSGRITCGARANAVQGRVPA